MSGVSLTRPVLALILSADILLHIPCCLHFYRGSFSYTSRAGFIFIWGFSLTYPRAGFTFLCWEFLLHIPCFFSFFFFTEGISLTHPMPSFFLYGELPLQIPCRLHFYLGSSSYTSHTGFIFLWGVSLTHPMLCFYWEFVLHIPCRRHFYLGSFSYTSRAGFTFISGHSPTHPMLPSFSSGAFLLHILCWLLFL